MGKNTHFVGMKTILLEPSVFREGIIVTDGPLKAVNVWSLACCALQGYNFHLGVPMTKQLNSALSVYDIREILGEIITLGIPFTCFYFCLQTQTTYVSLQSKLTLSNKTL